MKEIFIKIITVIVTTGVLTSFGNKKEIIQRIEVQKSSMVPNQVGQNPYNGLKVVTYIDKIGNYYFIVDSYHDQIIYNDKLDLNLCNWKVMTNKVQHPHTIASDGQLIVCDDTENNRLLVFEGMGEDFIHVQTIEGVGIRPHFTYYDEMNSLFMTWSSITGEMFFFKKSMDERLELEKVQMIPELFGVYVRSFTVIENEVIFVSGHNNQKIYVVELDSFKVKDIYDVPANIAGMVQILKIQDYYYITISTDNEENQDYATIIRTNSLSNLSSGYYEDIYELFETDKGTPYNITEIDGKYYLTHHGTNQNIISFDIVGNIIENVEKLY